MVTIDELIRYARDNDCSDIHLTSELPPVFRRLGELEISRFPAGGEEIDRLILSMLSPAQREQVSMGEDVDFCYELAHGARQRVNVYHQQNHLCAAVRILNDSIPSLEQLGLPAVLRDLASKPRGLILVTGPTGSGKSTTLAAMIDYINQNRAAHILTAEDPIEYVYTHKRSMIHQREVGRDVISFASALRSALREDPDVILVGEMRDFETISAAITAAETGHLVLSTLHTTGAAQTIDRIIDVFPANNQSQIRTQLAGVLKGVITQTLIPRADGSGRIAATEILTGTDAVLNLIRENKCHQLDAVMQTSLKEGMHTLNADLVRLVRQQKISYDAALEKTTNRADLNQYLSGGY